MKKLSIVSDLTYDDVLINPKISTIESRFSENVIPYFSEKFLPIASSPMDSISSPDFFKKVSQKIYASFSHRFKSITDQILDLELHGANGAVISLTTSEKDIERLLASEPKHLLLDVANGANTFVKNKLKALQKYRNRVILWSGNVANAEGFNFISPYCDFVRVGIGGGSACETRTTTGIGRGNISTILDIKENKLGNNDCKIVADGGIKNNADICKAIAAGADLVMLGSMFAKTEESAGEVVTIGRKTFKKFRGMASENVSKESGKEKYSIEGASGLLECSGSVDKLLEQIEANLRSSMSYVDARNLFQYYQNTELVVVSNAVKNESSHSLILGK